MRNSIRMSMSTIALLLLFSSTAKAGVIFIESFESEGLNQRYYANQAGSFDGPRAARDWHWQRQSINQSGNTAFYNNVHGQDFWAGINLDENGSSNSNPSTLSFNAISLADIENPSLEIDLAASSGLEATDFISIFTTDVVSHQKTLIDSFESGASIFSQFGLSSTFQTFKYGLSNIGLNTFNLSIEAFSNASKESFAVDNIRILAEPISKTSNSATLNNQDPISINAPSHVLLFAIFGLSFWLRNKI